MTDDLRWLAHRLVTDEVLKGGDAQTIMGVATGDILWQLWVQVALAYLNLGQPEQARNILEQLLQTDSARSADHTGEVMSSADPLKCDICGKPAFYQYLDVRETEPEGGSRCWEPDGPVKTRCSEHDYMPKSTYLDGHTSGGYNV